MHSRTPSKLFTDPWLGNTGLNDKSRLQYDLFSFKKVSTGVLFPKRNVIRDQPTLTHLNNDSFLYSYLGCRVNTHEHKTTAHTSNCKNVGYYNSSFCFSSVICNTTKHWSRYKPTEAHGRKSKSNHRFITMEVFNKTVQRRKNNR